MSAFSATVRNVERGGSEELDIVEGGLVRTEDWPEKQIERETLKLYSESGERNTLSERV